MIVVSAGMQRSGSGFYFNLTNDVMIACGKQDIRELKEQYHLQSILQYYNCNIGEMSYDKVLPLAKLHFQGNTFVVKSHCPPTKSLRFLMFLKIAKVTYIYRDPRDVIVSAIDVGKKNRNQGKPAFTQFTTIENSLPIVEGWVKNWEKWKTLKHVLLVRYEDLISNPIRELNRLSDYLSLDIKNIDLQLLIKKYHELKVYDPYDQLHFNEGIIGRYKNVMTEKEQELCRQYFGEYLEKMGYQ